MSHIYPHILPKIEDWPIYKFAKHRKEFVKELNEFVFKRITDNSSHSIEDLLAKTIYLETQRVRTNPWKVDPADDGDYWKSLGIAVNKALKKDTKEEELKELLKRVINRYNEEIVGDFNPKTFHFARKFLTAFFKRIFNKFKTPGQRWFWGNKKDLLQKIKIQGFVDETRNLFSKGTVVIVPTHFSNLDSIMIGYTIDSVAGLPAFVYGAGLNLYEVEIVAYFMNRLGAYRVDRRKKNPVYLECLTSMASYSLYKGVNNIFFPGGTRSRSGAMEDKLKYGLLSSAIDAQRLLLENNRKDKIFIVPVVLGYNFVLEASSLIDQHLQSIGKEKYSRSRDKSKNIRSRWNYLKLFFTKQTEMVMSFGEPLDVLGNHVDADGNSIDKNCNTIDLEDYFLLEGKLSENSQREAVYTRILAEKILESYFRNNVVLSSHLVAFVGYQMIEKSRKDLNLFAFLRLHPKEVGLKYDDFRFHVEKFLELLKSMEQEGKIRLAGELYFDIDKLIAQGLETLGSYHIDKVLGHEPIENKIYTENLKLLYFYSNRLLGYNFEKLLDWNTSENFRYLDKLS